MNRRNSSRTAVQVNGRSLTAREREVLAELRRWLDPVAGNPVSLRGIFPGTARMRDRDVVYRLNSMGILAALGIRLDGDRLCIGKCRSTW